MKKFSLLVLIATMFVACTTDAVNEQAIKIEDLTPETLTVSFEGEDSRIQLNEAGKTVWTEGDLVSVFYLSNANQKWQFQGVTGDRTGELKRVLNAEPTQEMPGVVVIYPYNENYYINYKTCNVKAFMPAVQTYLKDSFGLDGNIMISHSEYNQFTLKNVCGYLKLQLTGKDVKIKSIALRGNNGEQVAGEIYINSSDATSTLANEMGQPEEDSRTGGALVFDGTILTEVTLDCGEGVELGAEPTAFYIALPPQTFSKGFSLEIASTDGSTMTKSTGKEVVIERNHILPMAEFGYEGGKPKPANNEICYTSTDGAVVIPYAADVFGANIVSNTYENGKGVITFDGEVTSIGKKAFSGCSSLTSVTIGNSVTSIGEDAFYYCSSLTSITIPDSVTSIGGRVFSGCTSLTSITIPDSVTSIGVGAFAYCRSLTSVTIPDSVTSIGDDAFSCCSSLTSVTIPDSVTSIGSSAFYACSSLTSVTIGNSVTSIGYEAFRYCSSLASITIPNSVTSIRERAFEGCTGKLIVNCNIPSVSSSDHGAFYNSKFTVLIIGNRVTSIGSYAFSGCNSLTNITIPNSVTSIGSSAFYGCSRLNSVTIGNSVTSIGGYAFSNCSRLTSVYCKPTTPPTGNSDMFYKNVPGRKIYVPSASVEAYKAASYWSNYASDIYGYDF